jgi:hypothetical protein
MRLNHFIVRRHVSGSTAALAAAVLLGLAGTARAQSLDAPAGAPVAVASVSVPDDVIPVTRDALVVQGIVAAAPVADQPAAPSADANADANANSGPLAADPTPSASGDDSIMAGAHALDDQTLSHQRGGAVGMLMVAATPQLMRGGNSVTLWDEIAPPAPLPIPVDSSQAAQGNIASYTRK